MPIRTWNIGSQLKKKKEIVYTMELTGNDDISFLQETKEQPSDDTQKITRLYGQRCSSKMARRNAAHNACGGIAVLYKPTDHWIVEVISPGEADHPDIL